MQDYLTSGWNHENILTAFDPYRELFRVASSDLVRKVFRNHVSPQDRIIEIGSGLGELVTLAPDYRSQIQQTEQSQRIAEANKTLHPDSNVKIANVYNLPFSDGEFDVATGYSSFDTLENLEAALNEVGRVLTSNGKFIHFLDIEASANVLFHKYNGSSKIPFSLYEPDVITGKTCLSGIQLVDKNDLPKVREAYFSTDPFLVKYFDHYIASPANLFTSQANNPEFQLNLYHDSKLVKSSGVAAQSVRFLDFFKDSIEESLSCSGYKLLESGKQDGYADVQRNGKYSNRPQFNLFHNDIGVDKSRFDSDLTRNLGANEIRILSTLYVVVAQKIQ